METNEEHVVKTCDNCKWFYNLFFSGTFVCGNENMMEDGEYGEAYDGDEEVDCDYWERRL